MRLRLLTLTGLTAIAASCGTPQNAVAVSSSVVPAAAPATTTQTGTEVAAPTPKDDGVRKVALSGDAPVSVPRSNLTVQISEAFHKIRAPLVGVSVLIVQASKPIANKAQVSWRIASGQISPEWLELEGRRYDQDSNTYLEERIPGWLVRLDSIDDQSAGGTPTAITISIKRAP